MSKFITRANMQFNQTNLDEIAGSVGGDINNDNENKDTTSPTYTDKIRQGRHVCYIQCK